MQWPDAILMKTTLCSLLTSNHLHSFSDNFAAILKPVTEKKLLKFCHKKRLPQSVMANIDRKRPSLDGSDEEGHLMSPPDKCHQQ